MVVHCQRPLEIPVEKLDIKRTMISLLFGKMMTKKLIDKNHSFKQNIPIAKEFITDTKRDFMKEKEILVSLISRFGNEDEKIIKAKIHPFFWTNDT